MKKVIIILFSIAFLLSCTITKTETRGKGKYKKTVTIKKRIL